MGDNRLTTSDGIHLAKVENFTSDSHSSVKMVCDAVYRRTFLSGAAQGH